MNEQLWMAQVSAWGLSAASAGLSALALWYGLSARRAAVAKARRRAATAAKEAIRQYWRAADRDIREHDRRIEALEALEARRYATPALRIAGDDGPDLAA